MTHNFLKYAPLRMKPRSNENSGAPQNESPFGSSRHFSSLFQNMQPANRARAGTSSNSLANYLPQSVDSLRGEDGDSISYENINIWFQRQERRTAELQSQLDASIAENNRLKVLLEKAQTEFLNMQNLNKTVQDSHATMKEAVEKVEALCNEVNENAASAKTVLEQVKQDRNTWLHNLKELQRGHFDRRVMMVHADYQKTISEKDAELSSAKSRLAHYEVELMRSVANTEALQRELTSFKEGLEKTKQEKNQLIEEKQYFEAEYKKLNEGLNEMLSERTAEVIEELSSEKKRNTSLANDLKICQEKLSVATTQLDAFNKELQKVKEEEAREPKKNLRDQISSLTSEIAVLNNVINGYKTSISSLQEDLLSAQETNRRLDEANKSLPMLSKERAALQEKFVSLENQSASLSRMLTEASTQRDLYKGMVEERDNKLLHATNMNAELEEKVQILTTENNDFKNKMISFERENNELKERAISAEQNAKHYQEMAKERERSSEETAKNLEESQNLLTEAKKEISDLKKRLMGAHLKLEYANECLNQIENQENFKLKAHPQKERFPDTSLVNPKASNFSMGESFDLHACSEPIFNDRSSNSTSDYFAKPSHRSVHELPPKSREKVKENASTTPNKEHPVKISRSLNPLELLERADAIVAKEKFSQPDDYGARKKFSLSESETSRHQKRVKVDQDVSANNWEPPVAPSPVIRSSRKF